MGTTKHPLQGALDRLGLSQKKLAEISGVPQSVVCQVINQSGGREKFSAEAAVKMMPFLRDKKGKQVISYEELTLPPGEGARVHAMAAPAPRRKRR